MQRHVINPGGGAVDVPDVQRLIAEYRADDREPYVDLGGGMVVPLADHIQELREADAAAPFEAGGE